jgi:hypothetical protein
MKLAEKVVTHQITVDDLKDQYRNFITELESSPGFRKLLRETPKPTATLLEAIRDYIHRHDLGALRMALVVSCIYEGGAQCREKYKQNPATYLRDRLYRINPNLTDERSEISQNNYWTSEIIIQQISRELGSDIENKKYFLELFYDTRLSLVIDGPLKRWAFEELAKTSYYEPGKEEAELRSIRRWVVLSSYLQSLTYTEDQLKAALFILSSEFDRNEYRFVKDLENLLLILAKEPIPRMVTLQYQTLMKLYEREWRRWGLSLPSSQFLSKIEGLAEKCDLKDDSCRETKLIHSLNLAQKYLSLQQYDKVDRLIAETRKGLSLMVLDPVSRLMYELLPILSNIGKARLKGDFATVIELGRDLDRALNSAKTNSELRPYTSSFAQYKWALIQDEYNIGLIESAVLSANKLLSLLNTLKDDQDAGRVRDALIISVEGFLHRASQNLPPEQHALALTKREQIQKSWNFDFHLADRIRAFNTAYLAGDYPTALQMLNETKKFLNELELNKYSVPSWALRTHINTLGDILSETEKGNSSKSLDRLKREASLSLTLASVFGSAFNDSAEFQDSLDWANNYRNISPRLSLFFSKQFINHVHSRLDNLDEKLGNAGHNFVQQREAFIRDFVSWMLERRDYGLAYSALSALREIEQRELVRSHTQPPHRQRLQFDPAESKFNTELQKIKNEYRLLAREYLSGSRNVDLLRRIETLEKTAYLGLRKFSESPMSETKTRGINNSLQIARPIIVFNVNENHLEMFGQYKNVVDSIRIPLPKAALREAAYKDYVSLTNGSHEGRAFLSQGYLETASDRLIKNLKIPVGSDIYIFIDDALSLLPNIAIFGLDSSISFSFVRYIEKPRSIRNKNYLVRTNPYFFGTTLKHGNLPALTSVKDEEASFKRAFSQEKKPALTYIDSFYSRKTLSKALFEDGQIVHISSHFILGDSLQNSKLLLGDGTFITGGELALSEGALNGLNLLTLAACETGISNTVNFDSLKNFHGLGSELVRKGANEVIASLWRVSDRATTYFFNVFYEIKTRHKLSSALALRETQRVFSGDRQLSFNLDQVLKRSLGNDYPKILREMKEPNYWAGFVIFGSPI